MQRLGLRSVREYQQRYAEQPGLPSSPPTAYPEWQGWATFLAPRITSARRAAFLPLPEAMAAVGTLGIQDQYEYRRRYREAAGVPSNPERIYADWPGWHVYLGKGDVKGTRRFVGNLKTVTSRLIRKVHARHLARWYWKPVFWSGSYAVVTAGGAPLEIIKRYIESQQRPGDLL